MNDHDIKVPQNSLFLELHVPDFESVKRYYGALGFQVVWEREPDAAKGYLVLSMKTTIICFWAGNEVVYDQPYFKRFPRNTVRGYGVELIIMVDDIDLYYQKVKDTAHIVEELTMQPWGLKDFRCVDPFGYYLRVTSFHNILASSNAVK